MDLFTEKLLQEQEKRWRRDIQPSDQAAQYATANASPEAVQEAGLRISADEIQLTHTALVEQLREAQQALTESRKRESDTVECLTETRSALADLRGELSRERTKTTTLQTH